MTTSGFGLQPVHYEGSTANESLCGALKHGVEKHHGKKNKICLGWSISWLMGSFAKFFLTLLCLENNFKIYGLNSVMHLLLRKYGRFALMLDEQH
jgi:hypothetical protein